MYEEYADLLVIGKIYTADSREECAEGMAIKDGKVIAVGSTEEILKHKGTDTEILKPEGLVMPGIIDAHAHVTCASEMVLGIHLGLEDKPENYLWTIEKWLNENPHASHVFGSGYDNAVFGENGPTAALLDSVCADRPVVMVASDHHSRWINTKALEICNITKDTKDPENGEVVKDENGNPTGWLKESAMALANLALPEITANTYAEAIKYYQEMALSYGVTAVFEPMFDPLRDYALRAEGFRLLEKEGGLNLTVNLGWSLEEDDDFEHNLVEMKKLREHLSDCKKVKLTTGKFFIDGVVECHTAWLKEPYADSTDGDCGKPCISKERLFHDTLAVLRAGFDSHMHVIGDAAADMAADAIINAQETLRKEGVCDFRNSLTHLQIVDKDTIRKIARNGIICTVNPYWHYYSDIYYDTLEKPYLGAKRASEEYPMRSLVAAGCTLSQATDFPVTVPPDTMDSLHLMVTRKEPGVDDALPLNSNECLDIEEALDIMTIGGAKQLRLEKRKGSLEPGKDADFIVLNGDPFCMPVEDLSKLKVRKTFIAGKMVFCYS